MRRMKRIKSMKRRVWMGGKDEEEEVKDKDNEDDEGTGGWEG